MAMHSYRERLLTKLFRRTRSLTESFLVKNDSEVKQPAEPRDGEQLVARVSRLVDRQDCLNADRGLSCRWRPLARAFTSSAVKSAVSGVVSPWEIEDSAIASAKLFCWTKQGRSVAKL